MKMKFKDYYLLFISSAILLIAGLISKKESIIDINVHDTYFVLAHRHLCFFFMVVFFLLFTFYWGFEKSKTTLIKILYKIHIYGTILTVIGLFFPYNFIFSSSDFPLYDDMQYVNVCITISFLFFIFFQFLFIINIFVSIIKKLILKP